ncbi:N-6 DNA methylase [Streptomyces sp. NPDC052114]|uniref:N-6 DNA methylase n=1 Tax=unclassified Streptomyces TaxID=2593676 RepID=UPI003429745B
MPKPTEPAAPGASAQVTAAEISRIAGVTRATVSNWRRRHTDFPTPVAGTDTSPLYDVAEVRTWLAGRGHGTPVPPVEELRTLLRLDPPGRATATRLLPFVLAGCRRPDLFATAEHLPDSDLAARAGAAVGALPAHAESAFGEVTYGTADAPLLRAVLRCVHAGRSPQAADVLAERELEDTAVGGAYPTPGPLADLMAGLLGVAAPELPYPPRVFDPACGGGALLAAAARQGARRLCGQDAEPVQARRSLVRLGLDAPEADAELRTADSLRADAFPDLAADGVLCHPPYGDRDWGHDELVHDPRWAYGVPPRGDSELAWTQHALAHVGPGGFAVVLLPPATAARSLGRCVRAELIRSGTLRAVVALPPGAAPPRHVGLHVWILRRPRATAPAHPSVLCVEASAPAGPATAGLPRPAAPRDPSRPRADTAWDALTATVLGHWSRFAADPAGFTDVPGQARAVPVVDLLDDLVDVTPARHIRTSTAAADPAGTAERARGLCGELAGAARALAAAAGQEEWPAAGTETRAWRTASLADLTRGGALTLHRAAPASSREPGTPTPAEHTGRPVLTGRDLAAGRGPGADPETPAPHTTTVVAEGDVLLAEVRGGGDGQARVADAHDAGAVIGRGVRLVRPDPDRLDPWFLAGFLAAEDNLTRASVGTGALRVDAARLRVPLLPLAEQRRYGEAFRHLHTLREAARRTAELASLTPKALADGLTGGTLLPPPKGIR